MALFLCLVLIPTIENLKFSEIRYMVSFLNTYPSVELKISPNCKQIGISNITGNKDF